MVLYSRVTPFGFVNPATATEEDMFYGEEVDLGSENDERDALSQAEVLRKLFRDSKDIQTRGFGSKEQAVDMAKLLFGEKIDE